MNDLAGGGSALIAAKGIRLVILAVMISALLCSFAIVPALSQEDNAIEVGNRKAVILLPKHHEDGRDYHLIKENLERAGFDVDVMFDEEVDLELLSNLDQYSVVFLESHGFDIVSQLSFVSPSKYKGEWFFQSGVPYTREIVSDPRYKEDFKNKLLVGGDYVCVSAEYLAKYNEDFPNTLFYAHCCYSLWNRRLSDVLVSRGVQAIIGYDRICNIQGEGYLDEKNQFHLEKTEDELGRSLTEDELLEKLYDEPDDENLLTLFDECSREGVAVEDAFSMVYQMIPPPGKDDPPCDGWVLETSYNKDQDSFYLNWVEQAAPEEESKQEKPVKIKLYSEVNSDNYILIYEDDTVFGVYNGKTYTGNYWTDENYFSYIQLSDGTMLEHGPSGWSCFVWNGETLISDELLQRQEEHQRLQQ